MAEQACVAREAELAQLSKFLDLALAGQGQVCFVTGEAGAGKSTLINEFTRRGQAAHGDLLVAIGLCNAQTGAGDPYLPFRQLLDLLTGDVDARLAQQAISQENAGRLRKFLGVSAQTLVEYGPDLINLLVPGSGLAARAGTFLAKKAGLAEKLDALTAPKADDAPRPPLTQGRIFEQYTNVLTKLAKQQPLLLVLDDLHWVDAASVDLLFHLGRSIAGSPILIVGTYRPEDVALGRALTSTGQAAQHPLEGVISEFKRYYGDVWVSLDQTDAKARRRFVDTLIDSEPNQLDTAFHQALFQHTGGHPLFTSELLRELQERGDLHHDAAGRWVAGATLAWDTLPARVEGVIEKRIDRLAQDLRMALTVASVEGEEFTAQVVARTQKLEEGGFVRRLSGELDRQHRLVEAQGNRRQGTQRLSLYRFHHNLFQKYLYNSLDSVERSYLHEEVGTILEGLYGDQVGEIAVQLARHFQEAELPVKAIGYLQTAAQRATRSLAYVEAARHQSLALQLLATLPQTPERDQQELMLQLGLGQALIVAKGFGHIDVAHAFSRARELCEQMGDSAQRFAILMGLASYYHVRAQHKSALALGGQMLEIAQRQSNTAYLVMAHMVLGLNLLYVDIPSAPAHLEQMIARYDTHLHAEFLASIGGSDPGTFGLGTLGYTLWFLGYPDQAIQRQDEALVLARSLAHPYSLAFALGIGMAVHQLRGESAAARAWAEENIALSTQQEMPLWIAPAMCICGWASAVEGKTAAGVAQMQQGLDMMDAMGTISLRPQHLAHLIAVLAKTGQIEQGLALVNAALSPDDQSDQLLYVAELHRLKGNLLLMQGNGADEVEACYRQAIDAARHQSAKSLELRATMSLCRLLQQQGRNAEGRQLLGEIYGWFSEGFDTQDLVEAKTLMAEITVA